MLDETIWTNGHQESILLKIDPQEKYAYVFADSFVLSYDLSTNKVVQTFNNTFFDDNTEKFIPTAVDLTNEWAVVTGYSPSQGFGVDLGKTYPVRLRPEMLSICPISNVSSRFGSLFRLLKSKQIIYNRDHGVSVSIDPSGRLLALGNAALNTMAVFKMSDITNCLPGNVSASEISPRSSTSMHEMGFGRSVAWLDDQGTLAVLVYKSKNQTWSESEIHVFKNVSTYSNIDGDQPDFILPNNQQTFLPLPKTSFLLILAHSKNLLIFRDDRKYLYIPSTDAGSLPTHIEKYV
ncbi:unnamed protein product [Rotaria sp. Silwood1]|nr:unnamed protein product [Rotaria sp. Silwood1]